MLNSSFDEVFSFKNLYLAHLKGRIGKRKRECEKQYREGVSIKNIAKFYDSQKLQIEKKHKNLKHKLKAISKPAESPKS